MRFNPNRRGALVSLGASVVASGLAQTGPVHAGVEPRLESASAKHLRELSQVLAGTPRRRDFRAVPMILGNPDFWDEAAIAAVLAYKGGPKQAWDNTDL